MITILTCVYSPSCPQTPLHAYSHALVFSYLWLGSCIFFFFSIRNISCFLLKPKLADRIVCHSVSCEGNKKRRNDLLELSFPPKVQLLTVEVSENRGPLYNSVRDTAHLQRSFQKDSGFRHLVLNCTVNSCASSQHRVGTLKVEPKVGS